jgi:hypothetical protein
LMPPVYPPVGAASSFSSFSVVSSASASLFIRLKSSEKLEKNIKRDVSLKTN